MTSPARTSRSRGSLALTLLVGWLCGCPEIPPADEETGATTEGSERPRGGPAVDAFADTPLSPLAVGALERTAAAREPGDEVLALLVRADVATAAEDGVLSFYRVGLVQPASSASWLFELEPRAVGTDTHGHGRDELSEEERAVVVALEATVPVLSPEGCAALFGVDVCGPLEELARAAADPTEVLDGPVARVSLGSVGLLVSRRGGTLLLEPGPRGPRLTVLADPPSDGR